LWIKNLAATISCLLLQIVVDLAPLVGHAPVVAACLTFYHRYRPHCWYCRIQELDAALLFAVMNDPFDSTLIGIIEHVFVISGIQEGFDHYFSIVITKVADNEFPSFGAWRNTSLCCSVGSLGIGMRH
jgi:hypothetical protein